MKIEKKHFIATRFFKKNSPRRWRFRFARPRRNRLHRMSPFLETLKQKKERNSNFGAKTNFRNEANLKTKRRRKEISHKRKKEKKMKKSSADDQGQVEPEFPTPQTPKAL